MSESVAQTVSSLVSQSLSAHYNRVRRHVHALVEPLSTEQLWRRPFPVRRFGRAPAPSSDRQSQLLHRNADRGIRLRSRDRPKEFADDSRRPTADVLRDFDRAVDLVLATLAAQGEADWRAPYRAVGAEDITDRLSMFLRCAAHADHHAGQMIYLCKQLAL